jgi:allophanate hydrolase subunit 1
LRKTVSSHLACRLTLVRSLRSSIAGIYAYIPGVASLLIKYHPDAISQADVLDLLVSTSDGLARESLDQIVPSRRIHLPVIFNDSGSQAVIDRYMQSTGRKKAAYLPSNIEYMAKANGFASVSEIETTFCSADWYVASRSFFAGLPMIAPFDMRCVFKSQKYKYVANVEDAEDTKRLTSDLAARPELIHLPVLSVTRASCLLSIQSVRSPPRMRFEAVSALC